MFGVTYFLFYYNTDVCVHINHLANGDTSLSALFFVKLLYLYSEPLGLTKLNPYFNLFIYLKFGLSVQSTDSV